MKMKRLFRISFVSLALLVALTACDLYNAINLSWNIDGVAWLGNGYTRVTYTVQNLGKYDLTGVNLKIGVDVNGNLTYPISGWTEPFSLLQNQTRYGSLDIYTGSAPFGWATVLSVDVDNPPD
jgi:hypothetical protein